METQPDRFLKHPKHDELIASGETHVTQKMTSAGALIGLNLAIAPQSECDEYRMTLDFYAKMADGYIVDKPGADFGAFVGDKEKFKTFFNIDTELCECGRPYRIRWGEGECTCGRVHKSDITLTAYYEDNADDKKK